MSRSNIWASQKETYSACFCIGKQNGKPFCPCEMRARGIVKIDGRWVEPERTYNVDHGKVLGETND